MNTFSRHRIRPAATSVSVWTLAVLVACLGLYQMWVYFNGHAPHVADALLEPVADAEFGQRLRATVEVRPGRSLTAGELREWLGARLSRAERPREITIVAALPRTPTGKPLRGR